MILEFATKRDINGNRRYLAVDTEKRVFATDSRRWYSREDFAQITATDRRRMIDKLETAGFSRVDYCN